MMLRDVNFLLCYVMPKQEITELGKISIKTMYQL